MGVKLDNIFDDEKQVTENSTGVTDVVVTPKKEPVKKVKKEETGVNAIYDQFMTLLYCVDISGSMAEAMEDNNSRLWEWPENLKEHILRQLAYWGDGLTEQEQELRSMLDTATDDQIKDAILKAGPSRYAIYSKPDESKTKLGLVKKAISDLVDRRFEKYPDARVVLESFDNEATIEAATHETIKLKLNQLQPRGGTNITYAVNQALSYFQQYPSPVGVNHLIVVSDGEDWGAIEIKNLLSKMKEMGVVLDYIYIKPKRAQDSTVSSVAQMFNELCKELNGEYVEVSSANEFEKKLLQASTRLCLPPAA